MDDKSVELVLQDASHIERPESRALRLKALEILKPSPSSTTKLADLPETILEILTSIIKPLFSGSVHPKLTSTGRKVLIKNSLPGSVTDRFSNLELEDGTNRPLWKNGWSPRILLYVLSKYAEIGHSDEAGPELRKKTIEGHFYLLVPPILKQLDDMQISYKASGCRCLQLLCTALADVHSKIMKQSGLMDVFIEALKNDFSMLPTLTPEDESLELYKALYPAYRALVCAYSETIGAQNSGSTDLRVIQTEPANSKRQHYLTLLLRNQLVHGLTHLSTGIGAGSTMSVPLSTLLVSQIGWIIADMGLPAVAHLQVLMPLLRNTLADPFGTGAVDMLLEAIKALQDIVQICWPRIKEKWWGECLRGTVACWLNICADEADLQLSKNNRRASALKDVKQRLQILTCLLNDTVGDEFTQAAQGLVLETPELDDLFRFPLPQSNAEPARKPLISPIEA